MEMKGIKIVSENNFATAAGLASSSSGLSCLAACLSQIYGLEEEFEGQFTTFARLGSGSACRSLYGGFVEWHKGFDSVTEIEKITDKEDEKWSAISEKCIAKRFTFEEESYWLDNLRVIICVVKPSAGQNAFKDIPSTEGMKLSL